MYEYETLTTSPHPFDRRTVSTITVTRSECVGRDRYGTELRIGDEIAILTPLETQALRDMLERCLRSGMKFGAAGGLTTPFLARRYGNQPPAA